MCAVPGGAHMREARRENREGWEMEEEWDLAWCYLSSSFLRPTSISLKGIDPKHSLSMFSKDAYLSAKSLKHFFSFLLNQHLQFLM